MGPGTYHGLRRKHVDTYLNEFVFRYNRRFYRHVSFETMLGLAAHRAPISYWEIAGRANPRKAKPIVRHSVRRRKAVTGLRRDGFRKGLKVLSLPPPRSPDQAAEPAAGGSNPGSDRDRNDPH